MSLFHRCKPTTQKHCWSECSRFGTVFAFLNFQLFLIRSVRKKLSFAQCLCIVPPTESKLGLADHSSKNQGLAVSDEVCKNWPLLKCCFFTLSCTGNLFQSQKYRLHLRTSTPLVQQQDHLSLLIPAMKKMI